MTAELNPNEVFIAVTSIANLNVGETDVVSYYRVNPTDKDKKKEEILSDLDKWKEICKDKKDNDPDFDGVEDEEFLILLEEMGYSVENICPDLEINL